MLTYIFIIVLLCVSLILFEAFNYKSILIGNDNLRRRLEISSTRTISALGEWLRSSSESDTYAAYIQKQSSKLNSLPQKVKHIDIERQRQVIQEFRKILDERIGNIDSLQGKTMICLGARLGGEVRAFKTLGAIAIGIDLNPGKDSMDVLAGDFHNIAFPDNSFNYAYSNVLDHIFDVNRFAGEVCRIMIKDGFFFATVYPDANDAWSGPGGVSSGNKNNFINIMAKNGFERITEVNTEYVMKFPAHLKLKSSWY